MKSRQNRIEALDFQEWYVPTENGLKFLPGVLAEHMAESEHVFYAAETYYVYRKGVYVEMPELETQKMIREKMILSETRMSQITDAEHQWRILVQKDLRELNARTANVFARVEHEIKEQAESVLDQLGIPMSNAVSMFLRQIVLQKGIPFEMKLPRTEPLTYGSLTKEQFDKEIEKGMADVKASRVYSADAIEAEMKRDFGL